MKHGVTVSNAPGLIDPQYRGELKVLLVNTDPSEDYDVHRGDRIAQLVIQKVEYVEWLEVDQLDETKRDAFGFGSTGRDAARPEVPLRRHREERSASEFRDLARRVEDLGFSTFFMPDHFVDHPLAPIPGIMAAATATDHPAGRDARARQRLQASRRARQRGGHDRPALGRAAWSSGSARGG